MWDKLLGSWVEKHLGTYFKNLDVHKFRLDLGKGDLKLGPLELRPEAAPKLHLLAAFGPAPAADIGDPFGEEQPAYDDCLATMAPLLERVAIDIESGRLVRSA